MSKPVVLIVDNTLAGRLGLEAILGEADYQTKLARSYEEALSILKTGGVDLVITDIGLGKGEPDGFALYTAGLGYCGRWLAVTAYPEGEEWKPFQDRKVPVLYKSFSRKGLLDAVSQALGQ